MKNLLISVCFARLTIRKLKRKLGNVQKTLIVALFDFATFESFVTLLTSTTFGHHIVLFNSSAFGHSNCGRSHLEFSKLEERKR
jgi:hypothetical protein